MSYEIEFSNSALEDIQRLKKSGEKAALKKLKDLLDELQENPYNGTGQIEQLKGNRSGQWSRRISGKHRLIYEVYEDTIKVVVLSTYGHYGQK